MFTREKEFNLDATRVWSPANLKQYKFFANGGVENGCFKLQFIENGEYRIVFRQEVVAIILGDIKSKIEKAGIQVKTLVITVPDFATQYHRKMILQAAELAGFDKERITIRLLSHSTAAAICYFQRTEAEIDLGNYMFFQCGGGSTSISIFRKNPAGLELISTAGDASFGGEDFTFKLVQRFERKLKKDGIELSRLDYKEIRDRCEEAKISLSITPENEKT